MNSSENTINTPSSWPKAIVDTLENYGYNAGELLEELGIAAATLADAEAFLPQDSVTQLWNRAGDISGDDGFGIRAGLKVHAHTYPTVGYSLMSCESLLSSCERLLRYQKILAQGFIFELQECEEGYRLDFAIQPDTLPGSIYAIDSAISSFLNFVDWLTHSRAAPLHANLCRPSPENIKAFATSFRCPIRFNATSNSLYFSKDTMAQTLPTAHKALSKVHDENANRILQQLETGSFSNQLKQQLTEQLPSGEPRQEQLAKAMNISVSTLKRRLQSEQTTFKTLLDNSRRQLAEDYLKDPELSITDITYLLGFSESSAFNRAFKRWHDVTPSQWRHTLKNGF